MPANQINLTAYVEERLDEWGQWCKQSGDPKLGYSALSNLGKIKLLGGAVIDEKPYTRCDSNESVAEIERLLLLLGRYHFEEADALIRYYASSSNKHYLARIIGVSVRTLNLRMQAGKLWLEGQLCNKAEKYF